MSPFPFGVTTLAGELGGRDVMNLKSTTQTLWPHVSLRKHPFLLALRRCGTFRAKERHVPSRETSPAAKSAEKRMFSQANYM